MEVILIITNSLRRFKNSYRLDNRNFQIQNNIIPRYT